MSKIKRNKKIVYSKENNWLDKQNSPYKEDQMGTFHAYAIDGLKYCIDSDCVSDFNEDGIFQEFGKNKEISIIQKISRNFTFKKRFIKTTRVMNKRLKEKE